MTRVTSHMMSISDRCQGNWFFELLYDPSIQQCYLKVVDELGEFETIVKRVPNDAAQQAFNRPFEFVGWPEKRKPLPAKDFTAELYEQ